MRSFTLVLSAVFLFRLLPAQQYNFKHYTIESGLPQSQVMAILQDRDGYLWLATNGGGAAKFDGQLFTVYNSTHGMSDDRLTSIEEDHRGDLWFGSHNGLTRFDGRTFTVYGEKDGFGVRQVTSLLEDDAHNLWIGTEGQGLWKFDGKSFLRVTLPEYKASHQAIRTLSRGKNGVICVGSDAGVYRFGKNEVQVYNSKKNSICGNGVWAIQEDHSGKLWIGTYGNYVCRFDPQRLLPLENPEGLSAQNVMAILEDDEHNIWIGTDGGGLSKFSHDQSGLETLRYTITESNGLSSNRVRCIYQDREGNIWIGTDDGLSRFDRGRFTTYTTADGLNNKFVLSIYEDKAHHLYFGTQDGINLYNGKKIERVKPGGLDLHCFVWTMMKDRKNNFWIGTYLNGAYCIGQDNSIKQYSSSDSSLSNSVLFDIREDDEGTVWLGTDFGIAVMRDNRVTDLNDRTGVSASRVRSICVDRKGNVWFGTRTGLVRYQPTGKMPVPSDFKKVPITDKIDNGVIFSVMEDKYGFIWFGTYGNGLVRLNPADNTFINITSADGLSHNGVLSLLAADDYFWIGTINGINRFNFSEFMRSGKMLFRHFGKAEGFSGVEVNQNAILRDHAGNIWVGTGAGVVKYDPRLDRENTQEPITHISSIRLFFEDVDWKEHGAETDPRTRLPGQLKLAYNKNHLTFYFKGISYTAPEKVKYRFMLSGLDNKWSPVTSESYASYPGLAPGDYTFLVMSCNNEGVWNEKPTAFSFTITPPFWRTTWFYVLCSLAGICMVVAYSTMRTRNLILAKRKLEQEVQNRTRELHEKNELLKDQKSIIEARNKDITDSIFYARHIQDAFLPPADIVKQYLPDSFIFYKPRDIVSGDFYWLEVTDEKVLVAAADCTGHGVPGAMMSMLGNSALNKAVNEYVSKPSDILDQLNRTVTDTLRQNYEDNIVKDGMDIALLAFDFKGQQVEYSGANNPVYIVRKNIAIEFQGADDTFHCPNSDLLIIKGVNMFSVADGASRENAAPFANHVLSLRKGDCIYIFTDGYADQFGGPKGGKFRYKNFQNLLVSIHERPMEEQCHELERTLAEWMGKAEQVDDILVIGIRV